MIIYLLKIIIENNDPVENPFESEFVSFNK